MKVGPVLPLTHILALITGDPRSAGAGAGAGAGVGGGGEAVAGAESMLNPVVAQTQPLGSVQMMVMLAAIDPQRERRRGRGGSSNKDSDDTEETAAQPYLQHDAPEGFVLPAEPPSDAGPPSDPLLGASTRAAGLRARPAPCELDIEV